MPQISSDIVMAESTLTFVTGLCDLFLDSRIFNGHTTTTDALWSGIPVLTLPGKVWFIELWFIFKPY